MTTKDIVMFDAPDLVKQETVTGWVSAGHFYGNDERAARWAACTHVACRDCGAPVEKNWLACEECRRKNDIARWNAMPKVEWDGEAMLYSESHDRYFSTYEAIVERLRLLQSGDAALIKSAMAQNTIRAAIALLAAPRAAEVPRHVLASLECTAVWLEKGNDPQDAARELRACLAKIDAAPAAPVAELVLSRREHNAILWLLDLAKAAFYVADDSEEREGDDGREHAIDSANFDALTNTLEKFDDLPNDMPGFNMKQHAHTLAQWSLRRLITSDIDTQAVAADAAHEWAPDRIFLQRGQGPADSHTWHSDAIGDSDVQEAEYVRVATQAVAADGAQVKDVVTREQVMEWARTANIETGWFTEQLIAALGDFAILARAAVSPATAEPCAHDYVRSDRTCTECGEKPATADERAAFEAWWTREVPVEQKASAYALLKEFGNDYLANKRCAEAWKTWQAARASLAAAPANAREPEHAEAIADAIYSLTLRADELKESNTSLDGTWCDEDEKAAYEEEVALIDRLRAIKFAPADAGEAVLSPKRVEAIMAQAQVFASAWSLVGGVFDHGDALETAEEEKQNLRAMLAQGEGGEV